MPLLKLRSEPFFGDKNRAFWILQSAGWTGYLILRSLGGLANNMGLLFVLPTALTTATGYSLTLLMASAFRRLIKMRPVFTWTISIAMLIVAAGVFSSIETWSHATFYRPRAMPEGIQFFGAILLDFALLAAWSALYYGINFYLLLEEQVDRVERLEHQASSAQLEMLRYQLNPHFLFNTLNSISTLVLLKETQRANAMLSRLSNFLRYTLATEASGTVSLAQEIETLKLYLDIEKMRFEERLRPVFDVDPAAIEARLPSLLLQPLVENAVKYAVTPLEEGADIRIEARVAGGGDDRRLIVTVTDTGPGLTDGSTRPTYSTGVGLANIRDRLAQAYGADQRFEVQTGRDEGFGVIIDIPFQTEQQHKDAA